MTYLGHVVGQGRTLPTHPNVEAIIDYPTPSTRKSLTRFLGMVGFYRKFCSNFSTVAAPLTDMTSAKRTFRWTSDCEAAFHRLKSLMMSEPVLRTPDYCLPFTLHIDASSVGVGAALLQNDSTTDILHPVSYFSPKLKKHQMAYSTVEKECLSLVLALQKFQCYLPQGAPITV